MLTIMLETHSYGECDPILCTKGWIRVPLGPPNRVYSEPHTIAEEQFLAMVRFEQCSRLAELSDELMCGRHTFV